MFDFWRVRFWRIGLEWISEWPWRKEIKLVITAPALQLRRIKNCGSWIRDETDRQVAPGSPRTVSPSTARVRRLVRRPQLPLPFRKRIRTTEHSGLSERKNDRQVSSVQHGWKWIHWAKQRWRSSLVANCLVDQSFLKRCSIPGLFFFNFVLSI